MPCSHLITALFSELLHYSPPLTAPDFPVSVLFPFLVHSSQILVLHLQFLLHSPFLSLPLTNRTFSHCWKLDLGFFFSLAISSLAWHRLALVKSFCLFSRARRAPALSITSCPHLQRCFWAPLGSRFTKAEPFPLPLLLAASPSHSPLKLCSLDHFPGSSSCFTRSAVLLFSLALVVCLSWCCIIYSCLHFAAVWAFPTWDSAPAIISMLSLVVWGVSESLQSSQFIIWNF